MTAVDTLISDLRANRRSSADQPLISSVDVAVAALQQLASGAAITLAGDASGPANANQVTLTHLAAPLPIAQGGTAAITAALALVSLGAAPLLLQINNMIAAGTAALYKVNRCDATAGAFAVQLPAPTAIGDWCHVRKASTDATTNRVTVQYLGVDQAWLTRSFDEALFYSADGITWAPLTWNIAPLTNLFTSSGTWTKAPLAKSVEATVISGGAGGGSGRRGAAGSIRAGGGAGMGSVINLRRFNAADLSGTETITIGAGGAGGAAQTNDSTDGLIGNVGGSSSFGTHLASVASPAGIAGGVAAGGTGSGQQSLSGANSSGSSTISVTGLSLNAISNAGCATGGAGGSITAANADFAGASGGAGSAAASTQTTGGAGGASSGNIGGDATSITDSINQTGGGGGGGGGGNAAGVGGDGGNGGTPGGGAGGGGASVNPNNSGKGGNGARGELRVTTYF